MKYNTLRVAFLLGRRQMQYASVWTNVLITFVMMLTFLNLVVVSGILVGLIEGAIKANRDQYTGDLFISTPPGDSYIEESSRVLSTLETIPEILAYSPRFTENATIEANYRTRRDPQETRDTVGVQLTGIRPDIENEVTHLSNFVTEGSYLAPGEGNVIVLGANLLERYVANFGEGFDAFFSSIQDVYPDTKVRVTANGNTKEYRVKGIIDSKVDQTSIRAFLDADEMRRFIGRDNLNINEIAIILDPDASPDVVKQQLVRSGISDVATVRTSREALGQFIEDIATTFGILGTVIGSIGLVVASITIFIVIFINAITRRKYIGIMKGIGISPSAIEISYIFQAILYALIGSILGAIVIYGVLVPFIAAHPIDFPFSDGILVAPIDGTLIRFVVLMIATIIAGYIPARMIIKRNTLDAILGR